MPKMEWIRETKRGGEKNRKVVEEEEKKRKENQEKLEITYVYIHIYVCIHISVDQREGREATRVQVSPKFFISLSSAAFS